MPLSPLPYRNEPLTILEEHIKDLSASALSWLPPGGRNSIGWLLAHLFETEDFWVHQLTYGAGVGPSAATDDPQALLAEYRRVRTATDQRLTAASPAELARVISVPEFADGWRPPYPPTVHWVFHHVFEHEVYHIGQISHLLRLQGRQPLPF